VTAAHFRESWRTAGATLAKQLPGEVEQLDTDLVALVGRQRLAGAE
jgi:hypothetical protein